ncbi:MAG: GntR family transcriptional regulator [Alphaproteobacteria bacterium]|nr:GntR family transcriptional regulator [Alphaproteobacteria bacterium]
MAFLSRSQPPQRLDEWAPSLLKSRLYGRLLVDIIIGALRPGEQLDENELARRYEGGLAGIRDALARLALEGLVVRKARVGTTVAPLDLAEARDAFEARRLVEIHCAGLAAAQGSTADIAAIGATLAAGEAAIEADDARALAEMDEAFHVAVATASGNRTLAKLVVTLHHQTARYWLIPVKPPSRAESLAALSEHRALADIIASRNVAAARTMMEKVLGELPADVSRS